MKGEIILKTKHFIFIAAAAVIVISAVAYFILSGSPVTEIMDSKTPMGAMSFTLDENATQYEGRNPEDRGGTPGIKIPGYGTVTISSNSTSIGMILLNPEENPCYFIFELVVDGESLYQSGMVAPSLCIEGFEISKALKKGEYSAKLQISTYALDTYATMNGAHVDFKLVVL